MYFLKVQYSSLGFAYCILLKTFELILWFVLAPTSPTFMLNSTTQTSIRAVWDRPAGTAGFAVNITGFETIYQ